MYPSASLLGQDKDASIAALPVEELIEKADGFAGVFPGGCFCLLSSYTQENLLANLDSVGQFVSSNDFKFSPQSTNMKL